MSKIEYYKKFLTLFCFLFHMNQLAFEFPGSRRDRVVSDSVLHGTMLITNFSVIEVCLKCVCL